ncbi:MAG: sensor signal transduction histidine kinase [Gammaproteobacteria bacterium]|nr:sensor signal transduction histidine kinase [Gammaproteobacteria bacterium]
MRLAMRLRSHALLSSTPLLALALLLLLSMALVAAMDAHTASLLVDRAAAIGDGAALKRLAARLGSLQSMGLLLTTGQLLVAGALAWTFRRSSRRAQVLIARKAEQSQARSAREAERSQALLERLSTATQAAGIYCWELDWSTYAITWDESRLPPTEAAAASRRHFGAELGSDLFKWVHPDDQHAGGKAMSESLARGEDHVAFRYRIILPNESIRHVQAFARTYCDVAGKPQRSLGVSWDVTAEVEAAERASRNAANERAMLDRLSVATQAAGLQCWEYDFKQGKVVWLDQGLEHQGSTPESVAAAGEAMFGQILPEDLKLGRAATDAALAQRKPIVSTRSRRRDADGNLHHIQMYQRLFYDEQGERARALGAMLDVTESFQRQAELEALSIRFGIATRAANAGVWEYRERNGEIWWNDTMYVIYGCSAETFLPALDTVLAMIHPEDLARAQAAWANALLESTQLQVQFRIVRPDGSTAYVDSVAAVVTDPDTLDRRLVGISLDISGRVESEQRERQLQRQLREASHQAGMAEVATGVLHNVGNVLNSLGVASSTAQARLKACQIERVGQVAAILEANRGALAEYLTHDVRGKRLPDYVTALGKRLTSDAEALQQEFAAISGHVQYLRQIVQAQQSFAKVGGTEDHVDVRELVETALTLKGQELNGAKITRDIGELPTVRTDHYKLLQILVNFISNACDAMAANTSAAPCIVIRARVVLGLLEIAVEDSGVGIAPELLPRVWEFGYTTKAHGHGFGLHSAAVAAQQLGGTVCAGSEGVGLGAHFAVTIPISTAAEVKRYVAT